MHATYTTLIGRMITAPERHTYDSGASRVSFRVACTERRRSNNGWEDGETLYITVRCWRQLGENVLESMNVGDPIIAHGKVYTRSIDREGSRLSVTEMEAGAVGPDLRWATAAVMRTKAAAAGAPTGVPEAPPDEPDEPDEPDRTGIDAMLDDPWALVEQSVGEPGRDAALSAAGRPRKGGTGRGSRADAGAGG